MTKRWFIALAYKCKTTKQISPGGPQHQNVMRLDRRFQGFLLSPILAFFQRSLNLQFTFFTPKLRLNKVSFIISSCQLKSIFFVLPDRFKKQIAQLFSPFYKISDLFYKEILQYLLYPDLLQSLLLLEYFSLLATEQELINSNLVFKIKQFRLICCFIENIFVYP